MDVVNACEIRDIIRDISASGVTILLSSHNMHEVETLCNHVAMINGGEIILSGTPDELKSKYSAKDLEEVFIKAVREREAVQ